MVYHGDINKRTKIKRNVKLCSTRSYVIGTFLCQRMYLPDICQYTLSVARSVTVAQKRIPVANSRPGTNRFAIKL